MYGSLVYQDYINLIDKKLIITENIIKDQIQPSSIDLSPSEECYEIKSSFYPITQKLEINQKIWQ